MRIGIFGGTFDPWTRAHAAIVRQVFKENLVDKVIIIPTSVDYYRGDKNRWLNNSERLDVISNAWRFGIKALEKEGLDIDLAVTELTPAGMRDSDIENYRKGRRYYHTLAGIIRDYQLGYMDEVYTIIGTDQFENFKSWFMWPDILRLSKLIVVQGRDGKTVRNEGIDHINIRIPDDCADMSASAIREKYRDVPNGVTQYKNSCCTGERMLLRTPIFIVVEKDEVQPGFRPVGVNAPEWVTVLVTNHGKWLTVSQLRYGTMTEQCEFIAGQVDEGETPEEAAERELTEETGIILTGGSLTHLGSFCTNPAFMNNRMHYFYVDLDETGYMQGPQNLDEHEKLKVAWKSHVDFERDYRKDGGSIFVGTALWLYEGHIHEKYGKTIDQWKEQDGKLQVQP